MTIIKLTLFMLLTAFAIFLAYILYDDSQHNSIGGPPVGALIVLFVYILLIVSALILLFVMIKAPTYYIYVFFAMWVLTYVGFMGYAIIKRSKEHKELLVIQENNRQEDIVEEAWKVLESNHKKAYEIVTSVESESRYVIQNKIAFYLALSLQDNSYKSIFESALKEDISKGKKQIIDHFTKHYELKNQEDYLKFFQILRVYPWTSKGLIELDEYAIDYDHRDDFEFKTLVKKGYEKAALEVLDFKAIEKNKLDKYLKNALEIKDESYKNSSIIKILNKVKLSYINDRRSLVTTIITTLKILKDEKEFMSYADILAKRLEEVAQKEDTSKWKPYLNQTTQENFMLMYNRLTATHSLIKAIPSQITEYYVEEENKILKYGKENYILYRNYLEQTGGDETHFSVYADEPYTFLIDGVVVHEGLTNEYGCMHYKYYGAKPTDKIELQTFIGIGGVQNVGWIELLRPWDTKEGMLDRIIVLGFYIENRDFDESIRYFQNSYDFNVTGDYDLESAKKAKELFDIFMDEKWCLDE